MNIETRERSGRVTFRIDGFGIGRLVVFDDVQSSDLISLVNSEKFDGLEEAEDGGPADDIPCEDGPGPGQVPDEHHERGVRAGVDQA